MDTTTTWRGTLTATSSITHVGQVRGTVSLLRRETIIGDGGPALVPMVSGNTLRGRLRRVGEELLRDELEYAGRVPAAAVHALRSGGALVKRTGQPLSGADLARMRTLVPHLGVFGAAIGGALVDGCLEVGKVLPEVAETSRITGVESTLSAFEATQLEQYTRGRDELQHDVAEVLPMITDEGGQPVVDETPGLMTFRVETFPAGTRFHTWLRLRRPTPVELSFFTEVLQHWATNGRLGGRTAIGHGMVQAELRPDRDAVDAVDWRAQVQSTRGEVLEVLESLR